LKVKLIDRANQHALAFSSGARKVNADADFVMEMEKLGVECRLN
jgi:hypothetical protein